MDTKDYTPSEFYKKILADVDFDYKDALILLCAILIASIGLNLNSTPTIIGAMLISPLMTPIVAIGVSIALYSTTLLRKALRLLMMEILVSLTVSLSIFGCRPFLMPVSRLSLEPRQPFGIF